jgi:hypothetical protein
MKCGVLISICILTKSTIWVDLFQAEMSWAEISTSQFVSYSVELGLPFSWVGSRANLSAARKLKFRAETKFSPESLLRNWPIYIKSNFLLYVPWNMIDYIHLHKNTKETGNFTNQLFIHTYFFTEFSQMMLWVRIPCRWGVLDTTLCNKICQWQVSGFLRVHRFPPPIKLTSTK